LICVDAKFKINNILQYITLYLLLATEVKSMIPGSVDLNEYIFL